MEMKSEMRDKEGLKMNQGKSTDNQVCLGKGGGGSKI